MHFAFIISKYLKICTQNIAKGDLDIKQQEKKKTSQEGAAGGKKNFANVL